MITLVITSLWTIAFLILIGLQYDGHFSALWTGPTIYIQFGHITYNSLLSLPISDYLMDFWIIFVHIPMASSPIADDLNAKD